MADNWLKEFGFNPLRLPRRDLGPFDVLVKGRDGAFSAKAGTLDMLLSSAAPRPDVTTGEPTGDLAKKLTRKVDGKLGLSVLSALFGGMIGSKLGAETELKHARAMDVTYEDVTQDSLLLLPLQRWLEEADVTAPQSGMVMLNDERFAVVTAVLRSAKLSVSASREGGKSLALNVPEISGVFSTNAAVSSASENGSTVTFAGQEPIAFGFQAYVLLFEGNLTLGLDEVRGTQPDPADLAWTADEELPAIEDTPLGGGAGKRWSVATSTSWTGIPPPTSTT